MTECEICGREGADRKAKVEGAVMTVCDKCVSMGEEVAAPKIPVARKEVRMPEELNIAIRPDLGAFVKKQREKLKLTQEELARKLLLNVSIITRIESGWMPPLQTVEKLEKFFRASLKEQVEETKTKGKMDGKSVTFGDIVEIKKRH